MSKNSIQPEYPGINIALDMDQVMNHFYKAIEEQLNHAFPGVSLFKNLQQMEHWDHSSNYTKEVNDYLHRLLINPPSGFYSGMEPVEGLRDIVCWLKSKANLWIVSNPLSEPDNPNLSLLDLEARDRIWLRLVMEKKNWLRKYLGTDAPPTIFTHTKHIFHGQIIIDDRPDAFNKQKNKNLIHILYDDDYLFSKNATNEFKLNWNMDWQNVVEKAIQKALSQSNSVSNYVH